MQSGFWKRRQTRLGAIAAAVLAAGAFSGFSLARNGWAAEQPQRSASRPAISTPALNEATAPLASLENAFITIGERMEPSVVSIRMTKTIKTASTAFGPGGGDMDELFQQFRGFGGQDGPGSMFRQMPRQFQMKGAGSGVIVRDDGWILTNDHVAGGADKVTVKLSDGREFDGTVRRDFRSDLALIKINASNLVPAALGDSDKVRVGQWAIAFGSPYELDKTMTHGIISARARQQTIGSRNEARAYTNLLQTDAPINPGNSGGPLVNIRGEVVGINVAIESPSGGSVGIGFAIPSNVAKDVMDQLISTGHVTRGFLGVRPRAMTYDEKQKLGLSGGAMVQEVTDGTPAASAGLQPEDVIIRVNGHPIADDVALRDAVARVKPGSRIEMTVRRGGREIAMNATVRAAEDMPGQAAEKPASQSSSGKLGLRVETLTPDAAKQFKIEGPATGVVVVEVVSGSSAEEAGLQPGDVIVRANGRPVATAQDLTAAVQPLKSGDTVNLIVHHDKSRSLVTVKLQ